MLIPSWAFKIQFPQTCIILLPIHQCFGHRLIKNQPTINVRTNLFFDKGNVSLIRIKMKKKEENLIYFNKIFQLKKKKKSGHAPWGQLGLCLGSWFVGTRPQLCLTWQSQISLKALGSWWRDSTHRGLTSTSSAVFYLSTD